MVQERLDAAAGVGADQHLGAFVLGQLRQRGVEDGDVVGAVERRGPPGPQVPASVSPVPCSPWSTNAHIGGNPNPRL